MKEEIQYKPGDRVYIVANNVSVKEFEIIRVQDEYCTLRDLDRYGAIRIRKNRLFKCYEDAANVLNRTRKKTSIMCRDTYRSPHDL